jgi:hypothetical protein
MGSLYCIRISKATVKKFDEFLVFLQALDCRLNCFVLTESWLENDFNLETIPGYNYYRSIDNLNQNDGVVVYLDDKIAASCSHLSIGGVATALSLTFSWAGHHCEILAVYRSPRSNLSVFNDGIIDFYNSSRDFRGLRVLVGDTNFNILNIPQNSLEERYLDIMNEFGFISCINSITHPERSVDLCLRVASALITVLS